MRLAHPELPWSDHTRRAPCCETCTKAAITASTFNVERDPTLTIEAIDADPAIIFYKIALPMNPNITHRYFMKRKYPMSWRYFSLNPNLTYRIILQNLHKPWDFEQLSCNRFGVDPLLQDLHNRKRTKRIEILMAVMSYRNIEKSGASAILTQYSELVNLIAEVSWTLYFQSSRDTY